jgi:hypothetical protein
VEYESGTSDKIEIHLFGNQKHLIIAAPDTVTYKLAHNFWKFVSSSVMVVRFDALYWLEAFWHNLSVSEHKTAENESNGEWFCKVTLVVVAIFISVGWWTDGMNRSGWFCLYPDPDKSKNRIHVNWVYLLVMDWNLGCIICVQIKLTWYPSLRFLIFSANEWKFRL